MHRLPLAPSAAALLDDTTIVVAARELAPTDEGWYLRVRAICAAVR